MSTDRNWHMMAVLPGDQVLVAGGYTYLGGYHSVATAEVATGV
jgi:hypothetical protein